MVDAEEQRNVSLVSHHDLDGRPAFKIGIQEAGGNWYLYLASFWHSGWTVLDVTDPTEPAVVNFVEGPDNTQTLQVQVADGTMITGLEAPRADWGPVDGELYDPEGSFTPGAYVWDVETDPTDPELLGHYQTGSDGTHRNYYDGGRYAYMSTRKPGFTDHMLTIVDLSDPTEPTEVGQWWWPGQGDDDDEELTEASYFHGPAYVTDDRGYLAYGKVGMVILDMSDPTDPEYISRVNFGDLGSGRGVHSAIPVPDTDLIAVNGEAVKEGSPVQSAVPSEPLNYTFLVDVSDESQTRFVDSPMSREHTGTKIVSTMPLPTPEEHVPYDNYYEKPGRFGPHNQAHYRPDGTRLKTSDYLFMTYFNAGLRVFDISDPLAPTEAGHFVPEDPEKRIGVQRPTTGLVSHFEDIVVDKRGYIYCSDTQHGLFILETDLL
ncbi:MAG: LVIVD repeat-containing protein [Halobacteriota archaeon]